MSDMRSGQDQIPAAFFLRKKLNAIMRIRNRRGITMEDNFIGILIGCGILFLAGGILLLIAFLVFGKYLTQKKKCTATAEGAVVGYTIAAYSKLLR